MTTTMELIDCNRTSCASFEDKERQETGDRSGLALQWLLPPVFAMGAREDALSGPKLASFHPFSCGSHNLGWVMQANLGCELETNTQFGSCSVLTLPNLGPVTGHTTRNGLSPPRHNPNWAPLQKQNPKWLSPPRREPIWVPSFKHNPKWLVSFEDNTQFGSCCEDTTQNGSFPRTTPSSPVVQRRGA